jgi:hypothetical protein
MARLEATPFQGVCCFRSRFAVPYSFGLLFQVERWGFQL